MVKHTQTIRQKFADELLGMFYHFVELVLKGLKHFWKHCKVIQKNFFRTVAMFRIVSSLYLYFLLLLRMGFLLNTWHKQNLYIDTGLEIKIFARVYENLELLVNEKLVAYGTRIQILAALKSACAKRCYLIQKI